MKKYLLAALLSVNLLSLCVVFADEREDSLNLALKESCPVGFLIAHLSRYPDDFSVVTSVHKNVLTWFFRYLARESVEDLRNLVDCQDRWKLVVRPWMLDFSLEKLAHASADTIREVLATIKDSPIEALVLRCLAKLPSS